MRESSKRVSTWWWLTNKAGPWSHRPVHDVLSTLTKPSWLKRPGVTAIAVYGHIRFRTVGDLVVIVGAAVTIDALLPARRTASDPDPATAETP